jgi:hypothetical protein
MAFPKRMQAVRSVVFHCERSLMRVDTSAEQCAGQGSCISVLVCLHAGIEPLPGLRGAPAIAASGFHSVWAHHGLFGANATAASLRAAMRAECSLDAQELAARYAGEAYAELGCFRDGAALALLAALHVDKGSVTIDDGGTTWSAGAALHFLSGRPTLRPRISGACICRKVVSGVICARCARSCVSARVASSSFTRGCCERSFDICTCCRACNCDLPLCPWPSVADQLWSILPLERATSHVLVTVAAIIWAAVALEATRRVLASPQNGTRSSFAVAAQAWHAAGAPVRRALNKLQLITDAAGMARRQLPSPHRSPEASFKGRAPHHATYKRVASRQAMDSEA